jgi:hypothetical protein
MAIVTNKSIMFLLPLLTFAIASLSHATNHLMGTQTVSCNEKICTRLETKEMFRSTLQPALYAFEDAKFTVVDAQNSSKILKSFTAGDGYLDIGDGTVVLRSLKNNRFKEMIFNLNTGEIAGF